jgi:hypothetical protein
MGEKRNVYRLLVGKPEGKRPLGSTRCWWIDNIKMDLLEIGFGVVEWIGLAQDGWRALVKAVMTFEFHKVLGNHRVAEQLVASRVVVSCSGLVICYIKGHR